MKRRKHRIQKAAGIAALALLLTMSLAACQSGESDSITETDPITGSETSGEPVSETEEPASEEETTE